MLVEVCFVFYYMSQLTRDLAPEQNKKLRTVENLKKFQKLIKDLLRLLHR